MLRQGKEMTVTPTLNFGQRRVAEIKSEVTRLKNENKQHLRDLEEKLIQTENKWENVLQRYEDDNEKERSRLLQVINEQEAHEDWLKQDFSRKLSEMKNNQIKLEQENAPMSDKLDILYLKNVDLQTQVEELRRTNKSLEARSEMKLLAEKKQQNSLQERIMSRDTRLSKLKALLRYKVREIETLTSDLDQCKIEKGKAMKQMLAFREKVDTRLEERVRSIEGESNDHVQIEIQNMDRLQNQVSQLETHVKNLTEENMDLGKKIKTTRANEKKALLSKDAKQQELEHLKQIHQRCTRPINDPAVLEEKRKENELTELKSLLKSEKNENQTLNSKLDECMKDNEKLMKELYSLREKENDMATTQSCLQNDLSDLRETIRHLTQEKETKEEEKRQLLFTMEAIKEDIAKSRSKYEALKHDHNETARKQVEQKDRELTEVKALLKPRENEQQSLRPKLDQALKEREWLVKELSSLREKVKSDASTLEGQIRLQNTISDLSKQASELSREKQTKTEENRQLLSKLETLQNDNAKERSDNEALKRDHRDCQTSLDETKKEMNRMKSQVKYLEYELRKSTETIQTKVLTIHQLDNKVHQLKEHIDNEAKDKVLLERKLSEAKENENSGNISKNAVHQDFLTLKQSHQRCTQTIRDTESRNADLSRKVDELTR